MTDAPVFSVVMPSHNSLATIGSAIRSVLAQTRPDFELIVVDDGSSDGTAAEVGRQQSHNGVHLVVQANAGVAAARNTGIARARGEYVSFLDSDDLWLPNYLAGMGEVLSASPSAGLAYTDAWMLDDRSHRIYRSTLMAQAQRHPPHPSPEDPLEVLRLLIEGNFVFTSTTVRRAVLRDVGGFDESLRGAEDYELWLRIAAHGYQVVCAPGVLAIYRDRWDSRSADKSELRLAERDVYAKVIAEYDVPDDVRGAAERRRRECDLEALRLQAARPPGRVRHVLGPVKRFLLRRPIWYRRPPAEVEGAFPDLRLV